MKQNNLLIAPSQLGNRLSFGEIWSQVWCYRLVHMDKVAVTRAINPMRPWISAVQTSAWSLRRTMPTWNDRQTRKSLRSRRFTWLVFWRLSSLSACSWIHSRDMVKGDEDRSQHKSCRECNCFRLPSNNSRNQINSFWFRWQFSSAWSKLSSEPISPK